MPDSGKTLKDVAESLGISIATASRALAGQERISLETRRKVVQAADRIGYVPNRAARALVSGQTGFVGLVLPTRGHGFEDPFLGEFVTGLGAGLSEHGSDLFLTAVPPGESELSVVEHLVRDGRADGLVLARVTEEDPRVNFLMQRSFPFVAHGRILKTEAGYNWLDTDGRTAFIEAFDLLYAHGHRHFALVTISEPMTFRRQRLDGLNEAIARTDDPTVRLAVAASPRFDRETRAKEIQRLLTAADRPTAILTLFDGLAITVLQEAARLGLRVPEDISVIGFDNIPTAEHVPPGLTTFDTGIHDSAQEMAGMLMRSLSGHSSKPETRLVHPRLVLRGSHGPAPKN
ncbi:LacI family DNA-binding transcriptional regulator [Oricola cellulosilytica]|uniref:LacI family transcriptional regulator n=1 Tax=Oricola cellulosilytica TaxID=1429082 RepID=A0A4R0P8J8_9HYPH|nr:LacI family DNA-binding transcriptional regulator [Oricola cellulosilytica]TCD12301.1 LacI family transcriptional regulator [Oricola cellulosilytica]